jgi:hypothetical protein
MEWLAIFDRFVNDMMFQETNDEKVGWQTVELKPIEAKYEIVEEDE